jgi:hypothetical protein
MRKLVRKLMLLLMTMTLVLSFGITAWAGEENKLDVKTVVGFDGNYKSGYSTPVTLTISSKDIDVKGEVEIRVPSTPGKYVSYVKPLSLEKGAEKMVTINVPASGTRAKYKVIITNGGNKVYENSVSFGTASNNITKFIGTLSDDFDSLTYINKFPSSAGFTLLTKNIKLDEKNFPEDIFTLKAFDVLIINNFDTSKLNKAQYELLKQWVKEGGTLLIGTGTSYSKTLGIFKDDFIQGNIGEVKPVTTSKIYELATNGDSKDEVKVEVLSMDVKEGNAVIEDKGVKLTQLLSKGNGVVALTAFDLGQSPFSGWANNTAFGEKLLDVINPSLASNDKMNGTPREEQSYMVREILEQFSEMGSIKTNSFYIILFIYILVVAPISYIILKKLDKRELMWISVPVLSIVFGIAVYISGSGTRLSKVTTNMVSLINIDEKGNAVESSYAGIFTTKKSKIKVESKEGRKLIPVLQPYYDGPNQTSGSEELEAKVLAYEGGGIEYHNSSILQSKMIELQKDSSSVGKVETDIKMDKGKLVGTIKNSTNMDLEECYIITPGEYYKIDSIKSGESKQLPTSGKSYGGNVFEFIDQNFSYNYSKSPSSMTEEEKKKLMENNQKGSMLRMVYMKGVQQVNGVKLVAFSKTSRNMPLIVNGEEAAKNERSLIDMSLKLNFKNGDNVSYPKGFVPYNVVQNGNIKYDTYGGRLYGNGSVEIVYDLDELMKVEQMQFDTAGISYGGQNKPVISIFNFKTNAYEEMKSDSFKGEDVIKYLDKDNNAKLKIELKDTDCAVPRMSAEGKVKK